jgi:hypothetical protein
MKYKFDDNTSIMIDRSYVDFSGVEYQINRNPYSDHYKNGVSVRITKKGFKTLEENLNKLGISVRSHGFSYEYILEFVSDDLKRYLYFSDLRDIEPEVYKQILEKEEIEICNNCTSAIYHLDICAVCHNCIKCCYCKGD